MTHLNFFVNFIITIVTALTHLKGKPIMTEFLEKKEEYLTRMLNLPESNKNAVSKIAEKFFPDNDVEQGIEKVI